MDTAVILAGGFGTRLRPLTNVTPKALLPVAGKPILEWIFRDLEHNGFKTVVLCLGDKAEQIQKHFGDTYGKLKLFYSVETEPLGTGGALLKAQSHVKGTFLLVNGDTLEELDMKAMLKLHTDSKAEVTLAIRRVDDPSPFGTLLMDGVRVKKFVEKPEKGKAPSDVVNTGLRIIEPTIFDRIPSKVPCSIEREVLPQVADAGKMVGYLFNGQWFIVNTIEEYAIANAFWKPPAHLI